MSDDLRMPDLNRVTLAARLTRDVEQRVLPSGMAVAKLGLAASRYYKTKDGERKEEVLYINANCWGKTAEYVGENLHKGHPVLVEGNLKMEEWTDKASGQKRTAISINAERVQCLLWKGNTRGKKQDEPQGDEAQVDDELVF